jgi:hypothetical protein
MRRLRGPDAASTIAEQDQEPLAALGTRLGRRRDENDSTPETSEKLRAVSKSQPIVLAGTTTPAFDSIERQGGKSRALFTYAPSSETGNPRSESTIGFIEIKFSLWNADVPLLSSDTEYMTSVTQVVQGLLCLDSSLRIVEQVDEGTIPNSAGVNDGAANFRSVCPNVPTPDTRRLQLLHSRNQEGHSEESFSSPAHQEKSDLRSPFSFSSSSRTLQGTESEEYALILRSTPSLVKVANDYEEPLSFSTWSVIYPVWEIGPTFLSFVAANIASPDAINSISGSTTEGGTTNSNSIMTNTLLNINDSTQLGLDILIQYGVFDQNLQAVMPGFFTSVIGREVPTFSRFASPTLAGGSGGGGGGSNNPIKFEPASNILQYFGITLFILHSIWLGAVTLLGHRRRGDKKKLEKHAARQHHPHQHHDHHALRKHRSLSTQEGLEEILTAPMPQHQYHHHHVGTVGSGASPTEEHSSDESSASSMFTATAEGKGSGTSDSDSETNQYDGFGDKTVDRLVDLADFDDCDVPTPFEDMEEDDDIEQNSSDNFNYNHHHDEVATTTIMDPANLVLSLGNDMVMTFSGDDNEVDDHDAMIEKA